MDYENKSPESVVSISNTQDIFSSALIKTQRSSKKILIMQLIKNNFLNICSW